MAGAPLVDYRRLKVFLLLDRPGADVLTFILKHGTKVHTPSLPFDEYLTRLQVSSTANYLKLTNKNIKKHFKSSELRQIQKYRLWDNFDITLLYKAIRIGCEDIAGLNDDTKWKDQNEMEGLITKIKDERNACVHEKSLLTEADFLAKVNDLEGIYINALTAAKVRYSIPDSDFTPVRDKVLRDISSIKKGLTAKEILERDIKDVLPLFKEQSKIHLQGRYQQAKYIHPLSYLSLPQQKIDIQSMFCRAILTDKTLVEITADIDSLDLLTLTTPMGQSPQPSTSSQVTQRAQGKVPQFIMISGDAGSGKTTLLTFIMSEWLRDVHDCRIKHLTEYEIVLRILCCETNRPSLQDFLQQVLPSIFVGIKERLVALLKECKVLILIDGLDELSPGSPSDKLVTDILNEGKDVPGFTVICTSRPESVNDFLDNTPDNYQRWKMEMKGISSTKDRTDFVLRYYNSFPPHSSKDPDRLKYLMECTGWRDHFQLPLNLLFVATLFYTDPDSFKNNTTQTSLYHNIHEWCKQKLQRRLAKHHQAGRDRLAREESIRKVLKAMYHMALQGILRDRLSLSDEETHQLRECCRAENLPTTEVMGAFLCLREESDVMLVPCQKYFAPHKSLQEFFAAKEIVEKLKEDLSTGSIRHILQNPLLSQLQKLRNLLLHVAGLLSRLDVPPLHGAIQEVVDLLAETGNKNVVWVPFLGGPFTQEMVDQWMRPVMTRTWRCVDWLSLLEDTEVNRTALERVAKHVTSNSVDDVDVMITDSTITSAAALLPLIPRKTLMIELQRRETHTTELCQATAGHTCTMLSLWHHYKQPDLPPASDPVLRAMSRSHLEQFVGHLSPDSIMLLPQELHRLKCLRLAVSGDRDAPAVLSALAAVRSSLPKLSRLYLHVPVKAISPNLLTTPLPDVHCVCLILSGVEENLLEQTWRTAAALQPSEGYWAIKFPDSKIKAAAWKRLFNLMADARLRFCLFLGGIVVPDTTITKEEGDELTTLVRTRMLGFFGRDPEDDQWLL